MIKKLFLIVFSAFPIIALSQDYDDADGYDGAYEINGAINSTQGAPLPQHINSIGEKLIVIDPKEHFWGAYDSKGKLVRWGIASTGTFFCSNSEESCLTKTGIFRIYSLGNSSCISHKYPEPDGGAPMPYCMYFTNGQAIHGSSDVALDNRSHGCVRINVKEAEWLRYHFVEGPTAKNAYQGTRVFVKSYE